MNEREPDATEKGIRFGCGALLGALVALPTAGWLAEAAFGPTGVAVLLSALLFGWLALRFGDRFWGWVRHWWL
ncbi:MAG: hypothetical protein KA778_02535 [Burkholderiaceae bacterium]|jgi:hypothetical protein|nr:hypothetical protein [Burkholderiaceae bacterium]MBP6814031.1 hypothetical protein [Burkholderiaceae bacterium]MBP7658852.1 hypothetical protein [Burkholderiaceae bacterium]